MTTPKRLLESDDREASELIRSALDDSPPKQGRAAVLAGLKGAGLIGSGVAGAATSGGVLAAAWTKFLLVGVVAGVATGIALIPGPEPKKSAAPTPGAVVVPPPFASPSKAVEPKAVNNVTPEVTLPLAPRAVPSAPPSARPSLSEEIALLDQARVALKGGNAKKALVTIAERDKRFPRGMLADEALVLRIEALVASGQAGQARALGNAYLAKHPDSAHAKRVRSLIGAGE